MSTMLCLYIGRLPARDGAVMSTTHQRRFIDAVPCGSVLFALLCCFFLLFVTVSALIRRFWEEERLYGSGYLFLMCRIKLLKVSLTGPFAYTSSHINSSMWLGRRLLCITPCLLNQIFNLAQYPSTALVQTPVTGSTKLAVSFSQVSYTWRRGRHNSTVHVRGGRHNGTSPHSKCWILIRFIVHL